MLITSSKKRDKVSIPITSSNFILCSLSRSTQEPISYSLFLIYIKSNHTASTVKQLAVSDILLFIRI